MEKAPWPGLFRTCGGRRVEPGDLVVGDDAGVVVIPRSVAADVLRRITKSPSWTRL
jgi:regulator of RNase E activity RraA